MLFSNLLGFNWKRSLLRGRGWCKFRSTCRLCNFLFLFFVSYYITRSCGNLVIIRGLRSWVCVFWEWLDHRVFIFKGYFSLFYLVWTRISRFILQVKDTLSSMHFENLHAVHQIGDSSDSLYELIFSQHELGTQSIVIKSIQLIYECLLIWLSTLVVF